MPSETTAVQPAGGPPRGESVKGLHPRPLQTQQPGIIQLMAFAAKAITTPNISRTSRPKNFSLIRNLFSGSRSDSSSHGRGNRNAASCCARRGSSSVSWLELGSTSVKTSGSMAAILRMSSVELDIVHRVHRVMERERAVDQQISSPDSRDFPVSLERKILDEAFDWVRSSRGRELRRAFVHVVLELRKVSFRRGPAR